MQSRGALIVLEGCDRAGKTTQCKKLGLYYARSRRNQWNMDSKVVYLSLSHLQLIHCWKMAERPNTLISRIGPLKAAH